MTSGQDRIKKMDAFFLRHYRILTMLLILIVFLMSIILPLWLFNRLNADLQDEVNPTIINGILTATAIVFGFITLELRETKSSRLERFGLSVPLLFFFLATLEFYFMDAIIGKMTKGLVLEATANCIFNILYIAVLVLVGQTHEEMKSKT